MTLDGIIGWRTTRMVHAQGSHRRGQDTSSFLDDFICCVLPYIRPFPEPCSVVMLDNSRYGIEPLLSSAAGSSAAATDRWLLR